MSKCIVIIPARFDSERFPGKLLEMINGTSIIQRVYEQVLKASHAFNLLDARRAISVTERQRFILRVRNLSRLVAKTYYSRRESLGFPGLQESTCE